MLCFLVECLLSIRKYSHKHQDVCGYALTVHPTTRSSWSLQHISSGWYLWRFTKIHGLYFKTQSVPKYTKLCKSTNSAVSHLQDSWLALDFSRPKYVTTFIFQYPDFVSHDSRLKTVKYTGYQKVFAHVLANRESTEQHSTYQLLYEVWQ